MGISELTSTLMFLFLPGIIGAFILGLFTSSTRREWKYFYLQAYFIAMISYLIYWIFQKQSSFYDYFFLKDTSLNPFEIAIVTLIAIVLSIILVFIIEKNYFYEFVVCIGLSSYYGSNDIWDELFELTNEKDKITWIVIRDGETNKEYEGQLLLYSNRQDKKEITLKHVIIRQHNGDLVKIVAEKEYVYFNLENKDNLILEIQNLENSGGS